MLHALTLGMAVTVLYAAVFMLTGWANSHVSQNDYEIAQHPELAIPFKRVLAWLLRGAKALRPEPRRERPAASPTEEPQQTAPDTAQAPAHKPAQPIIRQAELQHRRPPCGSGPSARAEATAASSLPSSTA
jgi:hypothetical protein